MKSFEIFAANKSIDPLNYKLFIDEINKIMYFVVIWKKDTILLHLIFETISLPKLLLTIICSFQISIFGTPRRTV